MTPETLPDNPVTTIIAAIMGQRCVTAAWNRDKVVLAPHILYMRHGEPYIDAVTIARNNMLPREAKLGTYKLAGLGNLAATGREFTPSDLFDPDAGKYAGGVLMAVERGEIAA